MSLDQNDIDRLVTAYRGEFTPDVEGGLRRLHARIKPAQPLRVSHRSRYLRPLAIAASLLLLLAAGLYLFRGDGRTYLINDDRAVADYRLPDGTHLTLQQGSRVSYDADNFNLADRQLDLYGQGYFEVVHDASRPFIVRNGHSLVRVTGTAFNLRADGKTMEVEVSEGSVDFAAEGQTLPVAAMEYATVTSGGSVKHAAAPNLNHHAWRTGVLTFDQTPINEVLTYFADNWGIVCDWQDGPGCDYAVSGSFRSKDAAAVLTDIAKLGGLSVRSTEEDGKHFKLIGSCSK